jgi:LVIVD repeat
VTNRLQNIDSNQEGFLTLEIVLSLALASVFIFGICALDFSNQNMAEDGQNSASALQLANGGMEQALAAGFDFTPPPDQVSGSFTLHLQTDWLSDYAKKITSSVSFVSSGRPLKTEINSLVADWQNSLGRDTCALKFSGNWKNPVLRSAISTGTNNLATDVDAQNGKVYVSTNGSSASMPDFFVIDATDPDRPFVVKSINTGPGLNALHIAGSYAFAANSSINGQLQIIKISDPNNPTVMLNVKFADAATGGVGSSIFYSNGKVYVGTPKNDGPEFYVYNVQNPLAPYFLGEFEVGSGVNKIYVYGNYAYVATGDVNRLRILDISNPGSIKEVGDFSDVGGTAQSGESIAMLGGQAVFGRAGGLPGAHIPELYLLDVNNPAVIKNLNSADVNMSINDIFLRGGLAFMATNKSDGEFQVYNYSNNQLSVFSSAVLPATAVALDCDGENFYVALSGDPGLQIISSGH